MKPDSYMPFYGDVFFRAVKGMRPRIKIAYLEIIWYYWSHNHCAGLVNDPDSLQDISGLGDEEWAIAWPIIFDNDKFFVMDGDGLWRQKKADEEWAKSTAKYNSVVAGGRNKQKKLTPEQRSNLARMGAAAKWRKHHASQHASPASISASRKC